MMKILYISITGYIIYLIRHKKPYKLVCSPSLSLFWDSDPPARDMTKTLIILITTYISTPPP